MCESHFKQDGPPSHANKTVYPGYIKTPFLWARLSIPRLAGSFY